MCAPVRDQFEFDGRMFTIADGYIFDKRISDMVNKYFTNPVVTTANIGHNFKFGLEKKKVVLKTIHYNTRDDKEVPVITYRDGFRKVEVVPEPIWRRYDQYSFDSGFPKRKKLAGIECWKYDFKGYDVKINDKILIVTKNSDSEKHERYVLTFKNSKLVKTDLWLPGGDLQGLVDWTGYDYYGGRGFKTLYDEGFTKEEIPGAYELIRNKVLTAEEWEKNMEDALKKMVNHES